MKYRLELKYRLERTDGQYNIWLVHVAGRPRGYIVYLGDEVGYGYCTIKQGPYDVVVRSPHDAVKHLLDERPRTHDK
jgi:hypothetical protein